MSALDTYAGLTALIDDRNYIVKLPQQPTYPNTVLSYSRDIINNLSGESSLEHAEIQIDCRALTYANVRAVVIQIKAALSSATAFKSLCILDEDLNFDDDIETYRTTLRFSVWQ